LALLAALRPAIGLLPLSHRSHGHAVLSFCRLHCVCLAGPLGMWACIRKHYTVCVPPPCFHCFASHVSGYPILSLDDPPSSFGISTANETRVAHCMGMCFNHCFSPPPPPPGHAPPAITPLFLRIMLPSMVLFACSCQLNSANALVVSGDPRTVVNPVLPPPSLPTRPNAPPSLAFTPESVSAPRVLTSLCYVALDYVGWPTAALTPDLLCCHPRSVPPLLSQHTSTHQANA